MRPPATYRGPISVHGNQATVELEIPDLTFGTMPTVRLLDKANLPVQDLAHLLRDRAVCYTGEGGLVLNLYDPGGSILRILKEVEETLERSFGGRADSEFEAELASYWSGDPILVALSFSDQPKVGSAEIIDIGAAGRPRDVIVPTGAWQHLDPKYRTSVTVAWFSGALKHTKAFRATDLAGILDWLEQQSNRPPGLRAAVIRSATEAGMVFVVAPNAIIGWKNELPSLLKALRVAPGIRKAFFEKQVGKSLNQIGLERMTGIQFSLPFVVERNLGGAASLIGKKIALIGCGTIGSNLAKLLVQCGAGCDAELALYDTDTLRPGNLGRHLLGFEDLGRPKSLAVAEALRKFHPDVQAKPVQQDALKNWEELEASDLIIDATGDFNVATALNDLWQRSDSTGAELAVVHTWVFGNGIAVQAFMNLKDQHGCFRCLKPQFEGPWRHSPLKDPKLEITLAAGGCGEAGYIPFAVDAPTAAASLALRLILDWAAGQPGPRLRTVTLDHVKGREVKWSSPSPHSGCPACGR